MPLVNLDQVSVYYDGVHCGLLTKNHSNYTFQYSESYLQDGGPPISFNFPLQAGEFQSDGSVHLHPFFDNLASEGWLRQHQADALKTTDKFSILTHFGYDLAGAVHFDPPDLNLVYPMTIESNDTPEKLLKFHLSVESRASISGNTFIYFFK